MIASPIIAAVSPESPPSISDHELVRCIGRGSYGQVWLGRSMMGAWRAIKVIYRGEEGRNGFQRELAGIRKFEPVSRNSAGLVHILQVGQDPAQRYFYYVMELADDGQRQESWSFSHASAVRGDLNPETFIPRTLSLERRRRGRLPPQECLEIALALTEALVNLHEHGLVHRPGPS
jgi:eukaryotic-like serine/threonine-protein kinase